MKNKTLLLILVILSMALFVNAQLNPPANGTPPVGTNTVPNPYANGTGNIPWPGTVGSPNPTQGAPPPGAWGAGSSNGTALVNGVWTPVPVNGVYTPGTVGFPAPGTNGAPLVNTVKYPTLPYGVNGNYANGAPTYWKGPGYGANGTSVLGSGLANAGTVTGPHGTCMTCHAPHSSNQVDIGGRLAVGTYTVPSNWTGMNGQANIGVANGTPYGNATTKFANTNPMNTWGPFLYVPVSLGQQISGNIYLWGRAITTVTYTTWDNNTVSSAGATEASPAVHTLLCMTCHDNSMSGSMSGVGTACAPWTAVPGAGTYANGTPYAPLYNGSTTCGYIGVSQPYGVSGNATITGALPKTWSSVNGTPTLSNGVGPTFTANVLNWGSNPQGNLADNHPVHVIYPKNGIDRFGKIEYWQVQIQTNPSGKQYVQYVDQDSNHIGDSGFVGHPGRLYTDGSNVYIECSSCHNPHRQTSPAWINYSQSAYYVGAAGTTTAYIRGPYSLQDGTISAGFCRSCHYGKSPEFINNGGASK